jgi:hypothetical protein
MTLQPPHFERLKDDLPHLAQELDRFVEKLNAELDRVEAEAEDQIKVSKSLFVGNTEKANQARFGMAHRCAVVTVAGGMNCSVWLPKATNADLGKRVELTRLNSGGLFKVYPSAGQHINGVATGISPSLVRTYAFRWLGGDSSGDDTSAGWRVDY